MLAEKGGGGGGGGLFDSYTTFVPMCMLDPSDSTHTKCWKVFFLVELWSVHSTNWRFFLRDTERKGPLIRVALLGPQDRLRGYEALLMRSLIRQIDECFVARSDVYPSRSATTRCVGRPPFTRDKKGPNVVGVPFSLTILGSFKCCFVLVSRTDSSA